MAALLFSDGAFEVLASAMAAVAPVVLVAVAVVLVVCIVAYAISSQNNNSPVPDSTTPSGNLDTPTDNPNGNSSPSGGDPGPPKKPNDGKKVVKQIHHFISSINKVYTPKFMPIISKYMLDLDDEWNKAYMEHIGRHCYLYHNEILRQITQIHSEANGDVEIFLDRFEGVKQYFMNNPDKLYRRGW
ncbi:MAG: AHH domain-containing protein [Bacillota bacterium]|nr:AHH domain-containing protein [Bacillota bacterium]